MVRVLHRSVAAFMALWFTVVTVEPARLHTCPMHDGLAMTGGMAMAHAGHSAYAHHAPADQDSAKHTCSCLGSCATSAAPAVPPTISFEVLVLEAAGLGVVEHSRPVAPTAFALPFGNGPPRA
jgi:hypothetical protein